LPVDWIRHPRDRAVIGIVRMYAYQNGVTNIFDVPKEKAKDERRRLVQQGWIVYHSVLV